VKSFRLPSVTLLALLLQLLLLLPGDAVSGLDSSVRCQAAISAKEPRKK